MPADSKAGGAKAIITRKVGPLPLIAWVAIGSLGLFVILRMRRGSSSGDADAGSYYVTNPASAETSSVAPSAGDAGESSAPDYIPFLSAIADLADALRSSIVNRNVGGLGDQSATSAGPAPSGSSTQAGQRTVSIGGSRVSIIDITKGAADRLMPRAADLAAEPAGGFTAPPLFQQISPTAVLDATSNLGVVNPNNRLVGYADPATGEILPEYVPGRQAIWR